MKTKRKKYPLTRKAKFFAQRFFLALLIFVFIFSGFPQTAKNPFFVQKAEAAVSYVGSVEAVGTANNSGYTEVADLYGNDTRDANLSVSWKIMGSTPDSVVPVVGSNGAANGAVTEVHVWRNAHQTTPLDVTTTTATGINAATINSPSITPVTSGAQVLSIGLSTAAASAGDTTITAPAGYTNQTDHNGNGTTYSGQIGIASKAWGGSGAEDPAAWTNITTSTSDAWAAATLAIRPAAGQTLAYVGSAEASGTVFNYNVDLSGLSLQQGDLVIVSTGNVTTVDLDPGVSIYDIALSSLSLQQGDMVVVATGGSFADNDNPGVFSSGYSEVADLFGNDTRDANFSVNWKIMGATPDSVVTCFKGGSLYYGSVTVVYVWRGVDQATPLDVTTTTATGVNAATMNSPSITPITSGAVVLSLALSTAAASAGDTTITAPTGYTNQADYNGNGTNMSAQIGIASKDWSGSGAEDPAAWAGITTSTSDSWAAATMALRPGPSAPAAPTNVAATDGTHTDKVAVTWTKSSGATGYKVYEDSNLLATLGDVATYDDNAAPAPIITAGTASASDGTSSAHVALSLSGQSANNGASRTYKVVATSTNGDSPDSATDTGYRGVGSLTYQWQKSVADSDASYSDIGGATTAAYDDTGAPSNGDGRYFKCVLNATGATQQTSSSNRGYRNAGSLSVDIVDSGGASVGSPSVSFSAKNFDWAAQTSTGTLGVSSQKIRINNTTATATWTLAIAATGGNASLWQGSTYSYDFNGLASAGRLQVDASVSTITPQGGCSTTGISKGSAIYFVQGSQDSINLVTAGGSAQTNCYWDVTGVDFLQDIPAAQRADDYSIDMTLTAV